MGHPVDMWDYLIAVALIVVGLLLAVAIGDSGPAWPALIAFVLGVVLLVRACIRSYDQWRAHRA